MRSDSGDLEALFSLTPLPAVPLALVALWRAQGDSGVEGVRAVVARDRLLGVELVRLVNSLESRRVESPGAAVDLLGVDATLNFSLTILVKRELLTWARRDSRFDRGSFWRHSVAAAAAGLSMAHLAGIPGVHAYAAGLLHDFGLLAIDLVAPRRLERGDDLAWSGVEFERIHARLGRAVAERWNLPAPVADAIAYHHEPGAAPAEAAALANLTCAADGMAAAQYPWLSAAPDPVVRAALDRLGIPFEQAVLASRAACAGIDQAEGVARFARPA